MDLQTRKIAVVQEFLSIESEELISRFEKLLKNKKASKDEENLNPMTAEGLKQRIAISMEDSKNGRLTEMNDFLAEIEKWD